MSLLSLPVIFSIFIIVSVLSSKSLALLLVRLKSTQIPFRFASVPVKNNESPVLLLVPPFIVSFPEEL